MRAQIGRSLHTMASGMGGLALAFDRLGDVSRRFIAALDDRKKRT
jgi:hypothetical protein